MAILYYWLSMSSSWCTSDAEWGDWFSMDHSYTNDRTLLAVSILSVYSNFISQTALFRSWSLKCIQSRFRWTQGEAAPVREVTSVSLKFQLIITRLTRWKMYRKDDSWKYDGAISRDELRQWTSITAHTYL